MEYLAGRGVNEATASDFRLGYVATDDVPGFERFEGKLAIPNICAAGTVVGVKFRDISGDDSHKYDQPAGQQLRMFNLRALAVESEFIAITEGEIDCITLNQLGVPAVSVSSGANSWNERRHWRLFEGYSRVVLFRDNDEAGGELAKKVLGTDLPVQVVAPPGRFKDINEAHVAGHGDQLVRLVTGEQK